MQNKHNHYHKDVKHLDMLDVYRVLDLFKVTNPALQHAIKKLLVPGGRGAGKGYIKDLQEAIDSIERAKQMHVEDNLANEPLVRDEVVSLKWESVFLGETFTYLNNRRVYKTRTHLLSCGSEVVTLRFFNSEGRRDHFNFRVYNGHVVDPSSELSGDLNGFFERDILRTCVGTWSEPMMDLIKLLACEHYNLMLRG